MLVLYSWQHVFFPFDFGNDSTILKPWSFLKLSVVLVGRIFAQRRSEPRYFSVKGNEVTKTWNQS